MTWAGWVVMAVSVGTVTLLFGWCLMKVLSLPDETEHLHGFEMETPDVKEKRE